MLGVYVSVPIACFRRGLAREYLETEAIPPPATCYGFLLSLVGEANRYRHVGCRIAPVLLNQPPTSVVLRTVWRVKKTPLGSPGNTRPDFQQLLTDVRLLIWLDSTGESESSERRLESRVVEALTTPDKVNRFGGLSLGESTHLVDEVSLWDRVRGAYEKHTGQAFVVAERGRITFPVWVDHVGSAGTRYVTGDLLKTALSPPSPDMLAAILAP